MKNEKKNVFDPCWPKELKTMTPYRVYCDDKGMKKGAFIQCIIAEDGDVHLSMQDWEEIPEGKPSCFPSIRIRTGIGGGRNQKVRQALLWLAEAMRQEGETNV